MEPKIVTTTSVFPKGYSAQKAIEILSAIGFDALDMAFDYWVYSKESPFLSDNYLKWAEELRELSEKQGIPYTHSHCPGGADSGDIIGRTIKAASILGARYMVLHPMYREEDQSEITDPERFIKLNAEYTRPWIEEAVKHDIIILSENLDTGASIDPRNIAELVREIDSENFGWCFDVGHANCFGYKPDILTKCEIVPLSLHIHDNYGDYDDHYIPGKGNVDWNEFTQVLKKTGYCGDCVLEAHSQAKEAQENERPAILSALLDAGKEIRKNMSV
ncbi:MAG: sugar phosphate isomerase/epimerase [Ruminococcaceae bacterium]|nr:sugar phosphate isomerase/epimerase [Oscillospiraceae bacterium]